MPQAWMPWVWAAWVAWASKLIPPRKIAQERQPLVAAFFSESTMIPEISTPPSIIAESSKQRVLDRDGGKRLYASRNMLPDSVETLAMSFKKLS